MTKRLSPIAKILAAGVITLVIIVYLLPRDSYEALEGLEGPAEKTSIPLQPDSSLSDWHRLSAGEPSRLALLLTDPNSAWTGVQQALESMGIPYMVTDDPARAVEHKVVFVYPMISGKFLNHEQQETLRGHVSRGGCLLATQVMGNDLKDLFGFGEVQESRDHYELTFTPEQDLTRLLTHQRERTIRLGNPTRPATWIGTQHYVEPETVLATYQDGKAAWIAKGHPGGGRAMALGFDLGFYILRCQNDRDDESSRSYVNDYEPSVDVWLRLLREIYRKYEPMAVTTDTVPDGRRIAAVMSFDVDYVKSVENTGAYLDLLVRNQVSATFFVQAKYYRDYFDSGFFNDESVGVLRSLHQSGMEIASHSVAHSDVFARLPLGTGAEVYPEYQPRVRNMEDTRDASILGELRVSKFLLERLSGGQVRSFRPGFLACPPSLPQALEASGYLYTSSVTAGNVLTYLPFRKHFNQEYASPTRVFEFPVAVEDEHPPQMDQRVEEAMQLAEQLGQYGGTFTVLSHPNVLDHKYRFFELILPRLKPMAWLGTLRELGDWWTAREQLEIDVSRRNWEINLTVKAPVPIKGVTFHLPSHWRPASPLPDGILLDQGRLFVPGLDAPLVLTFKED